MFLIDMFLIKTMKIIVELLGSLDILILLLTTLVGESYNTYVLLGSFLLCYDVIQIRHIV